MAEISDYFTHDANLYPKSGLEFYVFDSSKSIAFVQDCLIPFREAYISEEKLSHIVSRFPTTRKDAISRRLPRKGMVMSGDFGEILSFYLACQTWVSPVLAPTSFCLHRPIYPFQVPDAGGLTRTARLQAGLPPSYPPS